MMLAPRPSRSPRRNALLGAWPKSAVNRLRVASRFALELHRTRECGPEEPSKASPSDPVPVRRDRYHFGANKMPTEKQPRNTTTAKKTSKSVGNAPTNSQTVSTSQPAGGTARNPIITNNAALDLDEVRRR